MNINEWMIKHRPKPINSLWCPRCKVWWTKELTHGRCLKCDTQLVGKGRSSDV